MIYAMFYMRYVILKYYRRFCEVVFFWKAKIHKKAPESDIISIRLILGAFTIKHLA